MTQEILLPGSNLGLMGGGQLGRMFAQEAVRMGYRVVFVDPNHEAPTHEVAPQQIVTGYDSEDGIQGLVANTQAVTTEFENVPAEALEKLASQGVRTYPAAQAVRVTQNRNLEKHYISAVAQVPVAPHQGIFSLHDAENIDESLLPGILKTATLGYDGKGQKTCYTKDDVIDAYRHFGVRCILEKRVALAKEISVIVARHQNGQAVVYPINENQHRNGILATTFLPARIDARLAQQAQNYALRIAQALEYVGVLCIEFFVLEDGQLLVNELAPRPHNSGHATIEACESSQFEQQVRILAGLPLGNPRLRCPAVMLNILGDLWFNDADEYQTPDWSKILDIPGVKLHLYGKKEARHARKMGHITILGHTLEEAIERANLVCDRIGLPRIA